MGFLLLTAEEAEKGEEPSHKGDRHCSEAVLRTFHYQIEGWLLRAGEAVQHQTGVVGVAVQDQAEEEEVVVDLLQQEAEEEEVGVQCHNLLEVAVAEVEAEEEGQPPLGHQEEEAEVEVVVVEDQRQKREGHRPPEALRPRRSSPLSCSSWTFCSSSEEVWGAEELSLQLGRPLRRLALDLLEPSAELQRHATMIWFRWSTNGSNARGSCSRRLLLSDLHVVLLQLLHVLQRSSSVLGVLQQGAHVQHVVQVPVQPVVSELELQLSNANRMMSCPPLTRHTAASSSNTRALVLLRGQEGVELILWRDMTSVCVDTRFDAEAQSAAASRALIDVLKSNREESG
ncbi:hypothetical protein EYF80_048454 [Liparis tanakae]|uniref:Uncharacterized protein n=1 Tax=Liparis tanakae TaxID=230148 RepID=A0A4Z2FK82_9TELE|nr:hypothetical protein EYF80_048454 [Liparis tanakae]